MLSSPPNSTLRRFWRTFKSTLMRDRRNDSLPILSVVLPTGISSNALCSKYMCNFSLAPARLRVTFHYFAGTRVEIACVTYPAQQHYQKLKGAVTLNNLCCNHRGRDDNKSGRGQWGSNLCMGVSGSVVQGEKAQWPVAVIMQVPKR